MKTPPAPLKALKTILKVFSMAKPRLPLALSSWPWAYKISDFLTVSMYILLYSVLHLAANPLF